MTEETATLVASLREALRGRHDVHLAILFGSRARGRARPDSDLDLAVQGEDLDLLALARDLSLAIRHEVDVVNLARDVDYPLLNAIARDAIFVHQGQRGPADAGFLTPCHASRPTALGTNACAIRT